MSQVTLSPSAVPNQLIGWIGYGNSSISLGTIRSDFYLKNIRLQVTELFNDSGTDTITVGTDTDEDAYMTSEDVSSAGIKSITLGTDNGFNSTRAEVKVFYNGQNSDATTGKALIIFEFTPVPPQI